MSKRAIGHFVPGKGEENIQVRLHIYMLCSMLVCKYSVVEDRLHKANKEKFPCKYGSLDKYYHSILSGIYNRKKPRLD